VLACVIVSEVFQRVLSRSNVMILISDESVVVDDVGGGGGVDEGGVVVGSIGGDVG